MATAHKPECRRVILPRFSSSRLRRPPASGFIDHVCYTISNWDDKRVDEGLKESGRPFVARPGNVNVLDPSNYPVQLANIEEENPWK